jgi:hypothetical protein
MCAPQAVGIIPTKMANDAKANDEKPNRQANAIHLTFQVSANITTACAANKTKGNASQANQGRGRRVNIKAVAAKATAGPK